MFLKLWGFCLQEEAIKKKKKKKKALKHETTSTTNQLYLNTNASRFAS